jgi:hypothetical protein
MAQNENQKNDTRSASQKIGDLENALMALYQTADNMARDLMTIKDAIKLLGNKVDSIVKASSSGEAISDEVVGRIMIQNNVEELANKVRVMVASGILESQEQVGSDSFVVGCEQSDDGTTVNPRLQFALSALTPELQEKIKGSKVGDVLTLEKDKLKFKIVETYQIKQPSASVVAAAPSSAPASDSSASSDASQSVAPAVDVTAEAPAAPPEAPAAV